MDPFVFNDETKKNSHGFYLLNEGGDFSRFNVNPVMLDNHYLDRLIGKWNALRTQGKLLLADPVFDDGTALGAERKGQVERGFLRGASPGIIVMKAEWRYNAVAGMDDLYVTHWELFEGSTTPVPSNAGAITLKIYDNNHQLIRDEDVKLHIDNIVKLSLENKEAHIINSKSQNMEKITLTAEARVALGISESADDAAVSAAIVKLKADKETSATRMANLEKTQKDSLKKAAGDMVDLAIDEGRATADKREKLVAKAIEDLEGTKELLDMIPVKQTLAGKIRPIGARTGIPADRSNWTLLKWIKEDPKELARIKAEEPETLEDIKKVR